MKMSCTLCFKEFDDVAAKESCSACFLTGGCKMLKCPNCGFEMPVESAWARKLVNFLSFKKKTEKTHASH